MSISDDKSGIQDKLDEALDKYIKDNLREPKFIIVNGYSYQRILNMFNDIHNTMGSWSMGSFTYCGYRIASTGFLGLEDSIEVAS